MSNLLSKVASLPPDENVIMYIGFYKYRNLWSKNKVKPESMSNPSSKIVFGLSLLGFMAHQPL